MDKESSQYDSVIDRVLSRRISSDFAAASPAIFCPANMEFFTYRSCPSCLVSGSSIDNQSPGRIHQRSEKLDGPRSAETIPFCDYAVYHYHGGSGKSKHTDLRFSTFPWYNGFLFAYFL